MSNSSSKPVPPGTAKSNKQTSVTEDQPSVRLCRVHDEIKPWDDIDDIRRDVCITKAEAEKYGITELFTEFEGKHYCLLHLPTEEKDTETFNKIFVARLGAVDQRCTAIEAEFPDDKEKQLNAKRAQNVKYDFRYVWFPAELDLSDRKFLAGANFISATFSAGANFRSATFSAGAYFRSAIFEEKSQIYFQETRFCSLVGFYQAEVEGYMEFEGNTFLNKDEVKSVKRESETKIEEDQEAVLDLREIRLRNPERLSFNSCRLRPNWFVNVYENRKIVFNDVEWLNIEIDNKRQGLAEELMSLRKRKVKRPKRSLITACNQLADNAEANLRKEESQKFRKQSIALEKRICYVHFAVESRDKKDIRKKICRKYAVVNEDGGNYFCLWHNPDKNKAEAFRLEFEKEQQAGFGDFRSVVFPITVEYFGKRQDENGKEIEIPSPRKLDFTNANFQRDFIFNDKFEIKELDLSKARFEKSADLVFEKATCTGNIKLDKAVFEGKLFFKETAGKFFKNAAKALSLKDVRFNKPENANFQEIRLRPHYFVEANHTKFNFDRCIWDGNKGEDVDIEAEKSNCDGYKALAQVCNQLAVNYEENRDYEQSSYFRRAAMEANRMNHKNAFRRHFNLYSLYKWTSGYGENWRWALYLLGVLLVFFGILYAMCFSTFDYGTNKPDTTGSVVRQICDDKLNFHRNKDGMNLCDGMIHSLSVASFQRPEPKPADALTKLFVVLETILAPLQAALLALAIRRKFMR